ncbi:MAG: ABC transporter ATP-binding protein [Anaerolineales bacterium]|nr:ABC transporter ATP-binding protein [Anaerolineales bacterium]
MSANEPLLEVRHLTTEFALTQGVVHAVQDVSFAIAPGEVLGIVGESGCGKSVTALSLMRLVAAPGRIVAGEVLLRANGQMHDLLQLTPAELGKIRGNQLAMIFQDPMTSLNPVLTVGFQIVEPLKIHRGLNDQQAQDAAVELLEQVGIPEAKRRLKQYPHQFSGGMRQRVMIAIALACSPKLIIADEPTTALDVTIQAQILDLLRELNEKAGTSVIIITHDLGVVAEMANQVAVMYAGRIVEHGSVETIFEKPSHPYTIALMASIPELGGTADRLATIEGAPPALLGDLPPGCPFEPRCLARVERCAVESPALQPIGPGHTVACWVAQAGGR